jgi:hypothetical protein
LPSATNQAARHCTTRHGRQFSSPRHFPLARQRPLRPGHGGNRSAASNSQAKKSNFRDSASLTAKVDPASRFSARAASNPRITALRQIVEAGNSASSAISRTASTSSGGIKSQMRSNGSPPLRLVRVNLPSRPFSAGGSFSKCGSNSGGWKKGGAGGSGTARGCCCAAWSCPFGATSSELLVDGAENPPEL